MMLWTQLSSPRSAADPLTRSDGQSSVAIAGLPAAVCQLMLDTTGPGGSATTDSVRE